MSRSQARGSAIPDDTPRVDPRTVAPSRHCIFVRNLPGNCSPEAARNFFANHSRGEVQLDFHSYSENRTSLSVALRFESHALASEMMERFNQKRVMNNVVSICWFKDLKRAAVKRFGGTMPVPSGLRHLVKKPPPPGGAPYPTSRPYIKRGGATRGHMAPRGGRNSGDYPPAPYRANTSRRDDSYHRSSKYPASRVTKATPSSKHTSRHARHYSKGSHRSRDTESRTRKNESSSRRSKGSNGNGSRSSSAGERHSSDNDHNGHDMRSDDSRRENTNDGQLSDDEDVERMSHDSQDEEGAENVNAALTEAEYNANNGSMRSGSVSDRGNLDRNADSRSSSRRGGGRSRSSSRPGNGAMDNSRRKRSRRNSSSSRTSSSPESRRSAKRHRPSKTGVNKKSDHVNKKSTKAKSQNKIKAQKEEDRSFRGITDSIDATVNASLSGLSQMKSSSAGHEEIRQKMVQMELSYKKDCETFSAVTKLLVSKDRNIEDQLIGCLKEVLKELSQKCIQELKQHINVILDKEGGAD